MSFGGESRYVVGVGGKKEAFMFMGDMWGGKDGSDGGYIWLGVEFENGIGYMEWMDRWRVDLLNKK